MKGIRSIHRPNRIANFRLVVGLVLAISALALLASPRQLVSALREQPNGISKTLSARRDLGLAPSLSPLAACASPLSGMVGWWPGENNANDIQGTNSGTLQNGVTFTPGEVGQAFSLNGGNQYVLIGDPVPAALRIQNEITLSAWVYVSSYPSGSFPDEFGLIIGSQYDANHAGATIFLDGRTNPDGQTAPQGHIHFQIGDGSSWHTSNSNAAVPLNQWVYVVATRKANEDAKIYYNGVLQPVTSVAWSGAISYQGGWFAIGQQKDQNRPFNGLIDEAQVYNRALTAAEVQAISDAGSAGTCHTPSLTINDAAVAPGASGDSTVTFNVSVSRPDVGSGDIIVNYSTADDTAHQPTDYAAKTDTLTIPAGQSSGTITVDVKAVTSPRTFFVNLTGISSNNAVINRSQAVGTIATCTTPPPGMIGWWPGDGNANDIQGSNNGAPQNGAIFATGKVGQGFSFPASNSSVDVPRNSTLEPPHLTLDAWVKVNSTGTKANIVAKSSSNVRASYGLEVLADRRFNFFVNTSGADFRDRQSTTLVSPDVWYHVAGTWDGTTARIYVNGTEEIGATNGSGNGDIDYTTPLDFEIGNHGGASPFGAIDGVVDEVELFDQVLTAANVTQIYNSNAAGKCRPSPSPSPSPSPTPPTDISSVSGSGTYGSTATLTATLKSNGTAVSGKTISFTLNSNSVCGGGGQPACPTTNASGVATLSGVDLAGINAGPHNGAVGASFAGDANYLSSNSSGDLTVDKATPTITWSDPADIVYGTALSGTQLNPTASVAGASMNPFVYSPVSGTVLHAGNSQTLHVDFTPQDTTNYNNASKDVHINVTKATLTITADDKQKTYHASNPTLTYTPTGFVNSDTASILSGAPSITTTATTTSVVNGYTITITQGTLSAVHSSFDDYTFSFTNGTLTVNKATPVINWANPAGITYGTALSNTQLNATVTNPNDNSTVGSAVYSPVNGTILHVGNNQVLAANFTPTGQDANNYNSALQKNVSINVTRATLTITADNKGRPVNTANPPLTYTPSGFVNGDTASVLGGAPDLSTTATTGSPAADYPITITLGTLSASDYSFNFVNGTLSVGKVVPVINWSNPADIVYGTALTRPAQLSATATDPNTNAAVGGTFTYPQEGAVLHVGNSQTLTANFAPSDTTNYSAPSQKTVLINVTKATLTITAGDKSKSYRAANPVLTFTPSGFVNGDSAAVLSGAPVLSTAATTTSNAGGYSISAAQGTLTAADYSFNFVAGTLTVNKATPVISWSNPADIVFGTALSGTQLNATASNPNDSSSVIPGGSSTYSPAETTVLNAGNNQILAYNLVPADTTNYNAPAQKTVSINVLKSDQTISFSPSLQDKVVGEAPFPVSASASPSNLSVTLSIQSGPATISGNTVTITGAGPVTVHATQAGNSNFNSAATDQSFIVASAPGLVTINGRFVVGDLDNTGKPSIFSMNVDGTNIKKVQPTLPESYHPAWSPEGTRIAFSARWFSNQGVHLSVMNTDGSNVQNLGYLTEPDAQSDSQIAWSPDGKSLAWICDNSGLGFSKLCLRQVYNSYTATTVPAPSFQSPSSPAWSPDSKKIVFAALDQTFFDSTIFSYRRRIYVYNIATRTVTRLTNPSSQDEGQPNWSPDGTRILFGRSSGIWVMNADGSNQKQLTAAQDSLPKWSLDMKQIALVRHDSATTNGIYVMNADGTNAVKIYGSSNNLAFDWQLAPINVTTPAGAGATVDDGPVSLSFSNVGTAGTTSVIPINPSSAGSLPGGFAIDGASIAFDVTTTASYTAPITVCFSVPPVTGQTEAQFNALKLMHGENGVLVDRTIGHDFASRSICAKVNSLSPFLLATDLNPPATNESDDPAKFVRQQYLDFLNREPDQSGLDFWINSITTCGSDQSCIDVKRTHSSAAFFLSVEFQHEGYLVERTYKAAFGDEVGTSTLNGTHQLSVPIVRFNQFVSDAEEIGQGVIVNQGNWEQQLDDNKNAFMLEFVQRTGFMDAYADSLTPAEFVNKLFTNAGVTPSANELATAVGRFGSAPTSADPLARSRALRDVSENLAFINAETSRAFVLMEYFGYLRRDPNTGQDTDYTGYDFWLTKLNRFNGDFDKAQMVRAFIVSGEYRHRFGP